MKLYKKFLKMIENSKVNFDNEKLAKDLQKIAEEHFKVTMERLLINNYE